MPLSVIRIIISFPSPTLSFIPDLKPSFSANPSHCSLSFSSSGLTTWFQRLLLLLLAYPFFTFSVLQFLVVVSQTCQGPEMKMRETVRHSGKGAIFFGGEHCLWCGLCLNFLTLVYILVVESKRSNSALNQLLENQFKIYDYFTK